MSLNAQMQFPRQDEIRQGWTKRSLLALSSTAAKVVKSLNVLEVILILEVVSSSVTELSGRATSWGWYATVNITLAMVAYFRAHPVIDPVVKGKEKKEI